MDASLGQEALAWVREHAAWAGPVVFAVAFVESFAIIGLIVPGIAILFAVGALIGLDVLPFLSIATWAAAGAITGDVSSFWLGRVFHERLARLWPFRNHPDWLDRGHAFFRRHGGKSVVLGRFIGAIRPVLPAVAGMAGMSARRFLVIDVLSAIAWAPAYLLPGIVFGASLDLAAAVAGRLALLIALVAGLLWLAGWGVRRLARLLHPWIDRQLARLSEWETRHPRAGRLGASFTEPSAPQAPGLLALGIGLMALAAATAWLLTSIGGREAPEIDTALHLWLRDIAGQPGDRVFGLLAALTNPAVYLSATGVAVIAFAARRQWNALTHLAAGTGLGLALALAFARLGPLPPHAAIDGSAAAVIGLQHSLAAAATLGTLAAILATALPRERHWWVYSPAALLLMAAGLGRVGLGLEGLTGMTLGYALALAWAAMLGLAHRRHAPAPIRPALPGGLVAGAVLLGLAAVGPTPRPMPAAPPEPVPVNEWWTEGWRHLPSERIDLEEGTGERLTVQWAGELSAIRAALLEAGWLAPPELSLQNTLRWLLPDADLHQVPVLARAHDGRLDTLRLIRHGPEHSWLLRLWPSSRVTSDGRPIHLGMVEAYRVRSVGWFFSLPERAGGATEGSAVVADDLGDGWEWRRTTSERLLVRRPPGATPPPAEGFPGAGRDPAVPADTGAARY